MDCCTIISPLRRSLHPLASAKGADCPGNARIVARNDSHRPSEYAPIPAVQFARVDPQVLLLMAFAFAQQYPQEFIKLVESLVGQILRQLKQIGRQQRVTAVAWQIQEWLRLIFAAFACQLKDSVLV
jgi:hypothetical protein